MKSRVLYFDILRIIAISMVVMIHSAALFAVQGSANTASWDFKLLGSASSCAVPLFFMISGAIFLSHNYELSIQKILHKVFKILVIWICWGIIYSVTDMSSFSLEKLAIWTIKGPFHFWFLEYLIFIYLLSPVLRALVEYKDGQYVKFFLICWIIFGILKFTLNGITWHAEEIKVITSKIHFELCDFSGYFVLGHYLSSSTSTKKHSLWAILYLGFALLQYVIEQFFNLSVSTYSFTPAVLGEAICLFMFCKTWNTQSYQKNTKALVELSSLSFGIYLIYPLFLKHLTPDFFLTLPIIIRVLFVFFYILFLSSLVVWIINKISLIKKWGLTI